MKILLINQVWLREEFEAAGHEVRTCGMNGSWDLSLDGLLIHIDTIVDSMPGGFEPDRIIVWDNSAPLMISGLEHTKIPTLFYSVDTHHHWELHRHLAGVFDYTLIAQKDYASCFHAIGLQPEWMPLWASRYAEPSDDKQHDAVFVGNLNPALNPERVKFFDALREKVPVYCTIGEWWKIFPFSEIVMNQTVKGDLNFRVFEAMVCGSLLLTERSGNGLFDLFRDGEHLVAYEKNNVDEAVGKIRSLLGDRRRCREIGAAGREEILRSHQPRHRAGRVLEILKPLTKSRRASRHFSACVNYTALGSQLEKRDRASSMRCYVQALKTIEEAVAANETCTMEHATAAITAALRYDAFAYTNSGAKLLAELADREPSIPIFGMVKIRTLLNSGNRAEAERVARDLSPEEPDAVFMKSEQLISTILRGMVE